MTSVRVDIEEGTDHDGTPKVIARGGGCTVIGRTREQVEAVIKGKLDAGERGVFHAYTEAPDDEVDEDAETVA